MMPGWPLIPVRRIAYLAGRRLEETRRFYEFLLGEMPHLMERWRKVRSASVADDAS